MAYTPVSGAVAKVMLGSTNAAAMNWKLDLDAKVKDASNFRDGRKKAATLDDGTLTFTVFWDSADDPTNTGSGNMRLGVTAVAQCYVTAAKFFSVPVIISKIGPENKGVEDLVMMDVTAELNGTITYPV